MTTSEDLIKFLHTTLKGKQLIAALQREPYVHVKNDKGGISVQKSIGGVHTLIDAILKQTSGLMVAVADGDGDALVVDRKKRVQVPPDENKYTLKRIFLTHQEMQGFYAGFANQVLWPLSHAVFVKPVFSHKWWNAYVKVNQKFADAILEEAGDKPTVVWINDYQLSLLPRMLKDKNPNLSVGTFWHIPWPTHEIFRICPWKREIIQGMLGSDFIGFHRGYHVDNFIECARTNLSVMVDSEPRSIFFNHHHTRLGNLPAGIDFNEIVASSDNYSNLTKEDIKREFGFDYEYLIIGIDRMDYTKGLIERLKIFDYFLENFPEYQGKVVHLSISVPSRTTILAYKQYAKEVRALADKINNKYRAGSWEPIRLVERSFPREKLFGFYRLADICMVTSLDDGMNLVAKEYVVCAEERKGMLMLSQFTGASKDLKDAFLINPYDIEGTAGGLYHVLNMSADEKQRRNREMKNILQEHNIYQWGIDFIKQTLNS